MGSGYPSYLVTGGAGFIGSAIVHELVARGARVRVLDNLDTGRRENLDSVKASVEFIGGDICDQLACQEAARGVDFVIHQAALRSVTRSMRDPISTTRVNVLGTINMLQAAREAGVRRLVFAASSSVYGDTPELPKLEEMPPAPISPYAVSKLAGEHYCRLFHQVYGLETVSLRYFTVYGPRQDPTSEYAIVIPKFILTLLKGQRPIIYGDGEQSRDFTFVADVVEATIAACHAPGVAGQGLNIGGGKAITINDLVHLLGRLTGQKVEPLYAPPRAGDVRHTLADITRARNLLGYAPKVSLEEGLKRSIAWLSQELSRTRL